MSITKQTSGTGKIDPLMALFNAVQLMAMNPTANPMNAFLAFAADHVAEVEA